LEKTWYDGFETQRQLQEMDSTENPIMETGGNTVEWMIQRKVYVCMYVWMDGWMDGWMDRLKKTDNDKTWTDRRGQNRL
jgi:hypothetical protein